LKNGCFSVVFHLIFQKNEIKNEIKNGSKMRTVNTPNRDAHGKDFRPIFDQFSLQFLFNFTANLTFFAVKLKEN